MIVHPQNQPTASQRALCQEHRGARFVCLHTATVQREGHRWTRGTLKPFGLASMSSIRSMRSPAPGKGNSNEETPH